MCCEDDDLVKKVGVDGSYEGAESTARAAWKGWHRRGACGLHRQNFTDLGTDRNEIHVDVGSVSDNLADSRVALPGDTRASPPGNVQAAPSGRVWSATLKLDRRVVRVLPVHNDGGVSRYQA